MISPPLSSNHCRATYMTSFNTSFGTTDRAFAVSTRFQGMPKLPTSCQRGRAQRSAHPGHSRKRCWFPRTGIAEQSWLIRCCQRTGRNSWRKRSHWSPLEIDKRSKKKKKKRGGGKDWRMKKGRKSCICQLEISISLSFWPEGTCQKRVINMVSCSNQLAVLAFWGLEPVILRDQWQTSTAYIKMLLRNHRWSWSCLMQI